MCGHVARIREKRTESARRTRSRWVNNIRMDLLESGWGDIDYIGLAQDRIIWRAFVNSVLNLVVP
jgi:hypothetical protein